MKKVFILVLTLMLFMLLVSCDIQNTINDISDQIKDGIIDGIGDFIEKDTGGDKVLDKDSDSDATNDMPLQTPDVSDEPLIPDISDEVIESNPQDGEGGDDIPDQPTVPEIPEYIILERKPMSLNNYAGLTIIKSGSSIIDREYKFRSIYGFGRYKTTLDDALGSNPFAYFSISGIESSVLLDFDLSLAKQQAENEGEISYTEIADKTQAFANEYCKSNSFLSNVRRIEIGSNPDKKLTARAYARLLNTIYDDSCKQNGENKGTTFINPEIRLITGSMSTYNLGYVKKLMEEIKSLRTDSFLPIGAWSFSPSTEGKSPEEIFLRNEELSELIAYRNEYYDSIEIHVNDYVWDTVNNESESYVAPSGSYTSEDLQAMYIIRAYLILNAMGVDATAYGALNDTQGEGTGIIKADKSNKAAYGVLEFFNKAKENA